MARMKNGKVTGKEKQRHLLLFSDIAIVTKPAINKTAKERPTNTRRARRYLAVPHKNKGYVVYVYHSLT